MRKLFVLVGMMMIATSAFAADIVVGAWGPLVLTQSSDVTIDYTLGRYINVTTADLTLAFPSTLPTATTLNIPSSPNVAVNWLSNVDMDVTVHSGGKLTNTTPKYASHDLNLQLAVATSGLITNPGVAMAPVPWANWTTTAPHGNGGNGISINGTIDRHGLDDAAGTYSQLTAGVLDKLSVTLAEQF